MFRDVFLALINLLIIEPAQTGFSARLTQLRAPSVTMRNVSSCVSAAPAVLAEIYIRDPVRGVLTAAKIWMGMTTYEAVLQAGVPECGPALQAAKPYLARSNS